MYIELSSKYNPLARSSLNDPSLTKLELLPFQANTRGLLMRAQWIRNYRHLNVVIRTATAAVAEPHPRGK